METPENFTWIKGAREGLDMCIAVYAPHLEPDMMITLLLECAAKVMYANSIGIKEADRRKWFHALANIALDAQKRRQKRQAIGEQFKGYKDQ
jgi:hypothetical protein